MTRPPPSDPVTTEIDERLLSGFTFTCRPDCGLCCYTSPRLDGSDESRLRLVAPATRVVSHDGERCIAARPDGGACELLEGNRCRAHTGRPAPCREFPVSVHVGVRAQATLVLSCPGLPLDTLDGFSADSIRSPPQGLEAEIRSVLDRAPAVLERVRADALRRRRRIARDLGVEGRWVDEEDVLRVLGLGRLVPTAESYVPGELPTADEGLEPLPMCFDGRSGPVALAQSSGGWEALEVFAEGGARSLGVAVPSGQPPALDPEAERLLEGYLHYFLARDGFLAAVHLDMARFAGGTVTEVALEELHRIGSDVLARGAVLAQLHGESGARLSRADVERGIRATDQDWLDRPTWGRRL